MTTTWRKMESWRPFDTWVEAPTWSVQRYNGTEQLTGGRFNRFRRFKTRATALRAANKQNRLEGLPLVS